MSTVSNTPEEIRLKWNRSLKSWVEDHIPDWDEEIPVVDWLKQLGSEKTKKNALREFPLFLGFVQQSPTEIYNKRVTDLQSRDPKIRSQYELKVIEFKNALEDHHYSKNTIISAIGRTQSFFSNNYVKLSFRRNALKVNVSDYVKSTHRTKIPPSNEDIKKMYQIADLDDKLLLMFCYQYGNAPVDVSNLRIETIPINQDTPVEDFIYWEYFREKTDVPVRTALNPEIIYDYKALLQIRDNPKEGWVFVTNRGNQLRSDHINDRIKTLAIKAEINNYEQFTVTDLRDAFNEACLESKINPELKDALFGHKRSGAKEAYPISIKGIVEAYKTVFRIVSLNHTALGGKGIEKIEEILSEVITALLTPDPKIALISVIEKTGKIKEGTINELLMKTGRITSEQIKNMIFRK